MVQVFKNTLAAARSDLSKAAATLVISFYKSTRMLDLVLASLENQTLKDFNIIIVDDGSPQDIVNHVQKKLNDLRYPALHLWHEDLGFRKNRILNWGIHYSQTEKLVFIDQDCVLHPEFMREHVEHLEPSSVLCGRRINLTETASKILTPEKVRQGFLEKSIWWIALSGMFMKDNNGTKGLYFKSEALRKIANKKLRGIVGCNFSVFKKDLLAINGFDTRYEGAGHGEDSDIEFRLSLNGVKMIPFCNTAVQYHVYHRLLDRSSPNEELFKSVIDSKKIRTDFGLTEQLAN